MSEPKDDTLDQDKDNDSAMVDNNLKRRIVISSRASSLLDGPEEEDEVSLHKEPFLMALTDEDSDDSSVDHIKETSCEPTQEVKDVAEKESGHNDAAIESFSLLTEEVTSYLCPSTYDGHNQVNGVSHVRKGSDTDTYQQHLSSGPCGTTSCFSATKPALPDDVSGQPAIRNRCAARAAQARKVQQLWDTWHSTPGESPHSAGESVLLRRFGPNSNANSAKDPLEGWTFGVTKSLDGVLEVNTRSETTSPMISPVSHDTFAFAEVMVSRQTPQKSPSNLMEIDVESDLYYDSDPEVFRNNRSPRSEVVSESFAAPLQSPLRFSRSSSDPLATCRRRVAPPPPIDTNIGASRSGDESAPPPPPLTPRHSGATGFRKSQLETGSFDRGDEQFVVDFVEELAVGSISLVWHPSPDEETNNQVGSPVSVQGFFEMGSLLSSKLIQPKFMWRSNYQPDLDRKKLSISSTTPHSIELLSIIRILKPSTVNRKIYPFCKIDHTFTLTCQNNQVYVFEATSTTVRDWLVRGMKLVVSRLASMIIVGNDTVFREFFSPFGQHHGLGDEALKHESPSSNSSCVSSNNHVDSSSSTSVHASSDEDEKKRQNKTETVIGSLISSTTEKNRGELWGTSFWK